jgi:FSR family fosmidomycin resistance protein-like MFS transporter
MKRLHPTILLMAAAHFMVDAYGNLYAPLLPLLIDHLHLSLTAAGTLAMCYQISASISQIGWGHLADRWHSRALVVAGPFTTVVILSLIGVASSPVMLAVILMVGGLGSAAFHPAGAAIVHRLSHGKRGLGMATYITGGSIGMSLAPMIVAPFAERYGLHATPWLALPGLVVLALVANQLEPIAAPKTRAPVGFRVLKPYALPLSLLYLIVVARTITSLSFATFVPVMLVRQGVSVGTAGVIIAVYLLASGVGGFIGGPLADRFGPKRVIALSLVVSAPFLAAAPMLSGWWLVAALALGGLFLQSTLPVNIIFAQTIAPVSAGTVSSLMMGVAWGTGGLCIPFVGMLADAVGIPHTLSTMAGVPLLATICIWPLPDGKEVHVRAPSTTGLTHAGVEPTI